MTLFPNYLRYNKTFTSGKGAVLWDHQGKQYLDFGAGIGVLNLGHCHPKVTEALTVQAEKIWHISNLYENPMQQEVADALCDASELSAAFFCNSGAEANEAAFKLARKWAHKEKKIESPEIITFTRSFHGRTLATLTATGQDKVKHGFAPLTPGFVEVPFGQIESLKKATNKNTAAVCLELVQGEGGVYPADLQFISELVDWCHSQNILLIIDEIQTGMGRTGDLFAYQAYKIKPDVITLAKGLGNGFPLGAMLATESLKSIFSPGSHGTTFGGNPLAMSVAKTVIEELTKSDFLSHVQKKAAYLATQLATLRSLPHVLEIRSIGLMVGIELDILVQPLITKALEQGLVILPAGEKVIRLLPPLIVTEKQIAQAIDILKELIQGEDLV